MSPGRARCVVRDGLGDWRPGLLRIEHAGDVPAVLEQFDLVGNQVADLLVDAADRRVDGGDRALLAFAQLQAVAIDDAGFFQHLERQCRDLLMDGLDRTGAAVDGLLQQILDHFETLQRFHVSSPAVAGGVARRLDGQAWRNTLPSTEPNCRQKPAVV